jgi:hypothetical protein
MDVHTPLAMGHITQVATWLVRTAQLPWRPGVVAQSLVAAVLAFLWGIAFAWRTGLSHRRRGYRRHPSAFGGRRFSGARV